MRLASRAGQSIYGAEHKPGDLPAETEECLPWT